jgi:hypothetical protein
MTVTRDGLHEVSSWWRRRASTSLTRDGEAGGLSAWPPTRVPSSSPGGIVNDYCANALEYLRCAHDQPRALFSYSTRLDEHGVVVNDFRMPESLRYTINTYLGLSEAQRWGETVDWLGNVEDRVNEFLALHEDGLTSAADTGLLLVLLASTVPSHPAVDRSFDRIELALARDDARQRLNMQDLAWMLWGASSWADNARAQELAERLFELVRTSFVHPISGLPRHSVARYRAHTVSFGSVVYFLRAIYEYGEASGSEAARELFTAGVQRVLSIQAPDGAWPWMIDVRSGTPFDIYPIFSVHQDSMAMLFLFPAERYGIAGVPEAIERSFRWNFGNNELGVSLVRTDPCGWIYRSIERDERWPRARRYLRGLGPAVSTYPPRSPHVRLNRECRSYHLGWVLYTWSQRASDRFV